MPEEGGSNEAGAADEYDYSAYLSVKITDEETLKAVCDDAWEEYLNMLLADETRQAEVTDRATLPT